MPTSRKVTNLFIFFRFRIGDSGLSLSSFVCRVDARYFCLRQVSPRGMFIRLRGMIVRRLPLRFRRLGLVNRHFFSSWKLYDWRKTLSCLIIPSRTFERSIIKIWTAIIKIKAAPMENDRTFHNHNAKWIKIVPGSVMILSRVQPNWRCFGAPKCSRNPKKYGNPQ